jgi:hypothetical protein
VLRQVTKEASMLRRNAAGVVALAATAVVALSFKEWSATLSPLNGSTISGTATAQPAVGDSLIVTLRIKGARAGDTNPWHLHSGGCDSSGAVIGDPSRYAPMTIGTDHSGQATARVKAVLAVGVPYSVNVHRSTGEMTVVSCGNLRPLAGPNH